MAFGTHAAKALASCMYACKIKVDFSSATLLPATMPNAATFGLSCRRAQGRDAR